LLDTTIEDLRQKKSKLSALRAGLTHDLLTGRKRVTALLKSDDRREKMYA
jgi:hypothetical protein